MKQNIALILLLSINLYAFPQKNFSLKSPDENMEVKIAIGEKITYAVIHQDDIMIHPSAIAMELEDGSYFGMNARVTKERRNRVNQMIASPVYKKSKVADHCNELIISFKEG